MRVSRLHVQIICSRRGLPNLASKAELREARTVHVKEAYIVLTHSLHRCKEMVVIG